MMPVPWTHSEGTVLERSGSQTRSMPISGLTLPGPDPTVFAKIPLLRLRAAAAMPSVRTASCSAGPRQLRDLETPMPSCSLMQNN